MRPLGDLRASVLGQVLVLLAQVDGVAEQQRRQVVEVEVGAVGALVDDVVVKVDFTRVFLIAHFSSVLFVSFVSYALTRSRLL